MVLRKPVKANSNTRNSLLNNVALRNDLKIFGA